MTDMTFEQLISHHITEQLRLTEEANELRVAKLEEAAKHAKIVRRAVARVYKIPVKDLSLGHWICERSPTNRCFYNSAEDPANDFCIICGGPDERK